MFSFFQNRFYHIFFYILTISFATSVTSIARWAQIDEADVSYENFDQEITVYKNGRSVDTCSIRAKVLNEKGREILGNQRIVINSNISELHIIEAKAIYNGQEYTVPKEMIETKPLASEGAGFDQLNQTLISFPQVGIGTIIILKYKTITKQQPLPNYYGATITLGGGQGVWQRTNITIKSEIPLNHLVNDPTKSLEVTESKDKTFQKISILLKKPLFEAVVHENTIIPDHLTTWVKISSEKCIESLGNKVAGNFEKVLHEPLPAEFLTIKDKASQEKNPIDQMNKVSSLLSEKIRYMGDWRTIAGKFSPHSLKDIVKNGVGDCKDFSVAMGAILNQLGFEAHVGLVTRGDGYLASTKFLPTMGLFNHAMLKVKDKTGKIYWIDPTNLISMADGLFSDISDRTALVLSKQPQLQIIPPVEGTHSTYIIEKNLTPKGETGLFTKGILKLKGEQAAPLTGVELVTSPQIIKENILYSLSKEKNLKYKKAILPDLKSRIVKDLEISYEYEQDDVLLLTNQGKGIPLDSPWCKAYLNIAPDQVGTLYVGSPAQMHRIIKIEKVKIEDVAKLDFDLDSPWLKVKRESKSVGEDVEIRETITILKSFISAEETQSQAYQNLVKTLKTYCTHIAAILSGEIKGKS